MGHAQERPPGSVDCIIRPFAPIRNSCMRRLLLPAVLCLPLAGCGLDDLDLSAIDLGIGEDTGDNLVRAGAKDFVSCNQGRECEYLWHAAQAWLEENARFTVRLKNEVTFTAFNEEPDRHRDEHQYRVTLVPLDGGVAKIKAEAFCADMEACEDTAVEQVYKINEYLRKHKRALNEGLVELEAYDEPELPRTAAEAQPADDSGLADEVGMDQEYRRGTFQAQAQEALAGAGCLKQSKMSLLKSDTGEDLYEVACLTGIRHIVLRCTRDGCATLE